MTNPLCKRYLTRKASERENSQLNFECHGHDGKEATSSASRRRKNARKSALSKAISDVRRFRCCARARLFFLCYWIEQGERERKR